MKLPRAALFAIGSIALLSGISFARPSWPQELGLDFWEVPRLQNQIESARRKRAELQRKVAELQVHMWQKELILNDMVDGLIGLEAAATKFLALASESPEGLVWMRQFIPGQTDKERAIRQVLEFIDGRQLHDSRISKEFVATLQREAERLTGK
jgi:hypothetical protein